MKMKLSRAFKKLHTRGHSSGLQCEQKYPSPPPSPTSILLYNDESDEESSPPSRLAVPADVPEGFFAVYVGQEGRRYVIPLNYLKLHAFLVLLRGAEEEFGFSSSGAIRLPCDTVFFDHLLWLLRVEDPSVQSLEMEELLKFCQ